MDTVRTAPQAAAARRKRPSLAAKRVQNGPRSLLMVHEHTYCECGESYKSNHRLTGGKQGCSTGSCTSMAVDLPKKVFQASGHPKPDQKLIRRKRGPRRRRHRGGWTRSLTITDVMVLLLSLVLTDMDEIPQELCVWVRLGLQQDGRRDPRRPWRSSKAGRAQLPARRPAHPGLRLPAHLHRG